MILRLARLRAPLYRILVLVLRLYSGNHCGLEVDEVSREPELIDWHFTLSWGILVADFFELVEGCERLQILFGAHRESNIFFFILRHHLFAWPPVENKTG